MFIKLKMNLKLIFAFLVAFVFGAFATANISVAGEKYEKCYGISKIGENDGWGKKLNPGKYDADQHFDGNAWKFTEKGSCLEKGGQLEPFVGKGTPVTDG